MPGLDSRSQHEIGTIEWKTARDWARHGLWPGAVGEALTAWRRIARRPETRLALPCGCCGRHPRALLEEAMNDLTAPTARLLSDLVSSMDEEFYRRTLPDPHRPADSPWWERRFPSQPLRRRG